MIHRLGEISPSVDPTAFVAPSADVIGDVRIGPRSSVWFGTVIRGDADGIEVGTGTNIQDQSLLHVGRGHPVRVGNDVTVGHSVQLHGCRVEDRVLIGIGSILLNGAVVRSPAIIGAGSVVPPGKELEAGSLYVGSPAERRRALRQEEIDMIDEFAGIYQERVERYRREFQPLSESPPDG